MKKEEENILEPCPCMGRQNDENSFPRESKMKCMKGARWFLLIPGALITLAFLLGYFLEPTIVRILWLTISGILLTLGTIFYVLMNIWSNKIQRKSI